MSRYIWQVGSEKKKDLGISQTYGATGNRFIQMTLIKIRTGIEYPQTFFIVKNINRISNNVPISNDVTEAPQFM